MKKIRYCNDYCVGIPLQVFEDEFGFFGYDDFEGIEEYLEVDIPEDIKLKILHQQEEWEKCNIDSPKGIEPSIINIRNLRDLATDIMFELKNKLPLDVEIILFDEVLGKDFLLE